MNGSKKPHQLMVCRARRQAGMRNDGAPNALAGDMQLWVGIEHGVHAREQGF